MYVGEEHTTQPFPKTNLGLRTPEEPEPGAPSEMARFWYPSSDIHFDFKKQKPKNTKPYHCAPVVGCCDCPKPFLASCVPKDEEEKGN